jgi:hypothetical protein
MASTYPLEVVEAARWSKENAGLKGKQLYDAMQTQSWANVNRARAGVHPNFAARTQSFGLRAAGFRGGMAADSAAEGLRRR